MKKIIASQNAEIKNTYDGESQLSYMQGTTEKNANIDISEEEKSIYYLDEIQQYADQDITENNVNDMDIEDPLKQIHDEPAADSYSQTESINLFEDIDDTITKEADDSTNAEHYLKDISDDDIDIFNKEIEARSDITDYDELDIEDTLIDIPKDENRNSQSSSADYIDNLGSIDEVDLLKSILGDQYQGGPLLPEDNKEISLDDITENLDITTQNLIDNEDSEYFLPTQETVNNQLDKKLSKLEELWDELSCIWPVINDYPEKKIEIENLWRSLKKNDNYDDISFTNETFSNTPIDTDQNNYETTLLELNHILGDDNNILDTNNPPTDETDITDLYSVDNDKDIHGISKDNSAYSDLALIESILSEPDTPNINTIVEINEETDEYSNNDSSILDMDNLPTDKSIEPVKETESISSIIDELLHISTDNESTIDNSKDQLDSLYQETTPLDTDPAKEIPPVNDAALETEPASTLPEASLLENEINADTSIDFPENSPEIFSSTMGENKVDAPDPALNNKINSVKTSTMIRNQLITAEKTTFSKTPELDHTSTLDKHAAPTTDKASSRKTASTLIFAATASTIMISSWIYFTSDESKIERVTSSLPHEQKSISIRVPDESPSNDEVNNRGALSQVNKNLSQEKPLEIAHIETGQVNTTYQETEEYLPDSSINDDPVSSQSSVDLSQTEYAEINQLNSTYQDSPEYDTANNEIPTQSAINELEQTSNQPKPAIENENITNIDNPPVTPLEESRTDDSIQLYKEVNRPEDSEQIRPEISNKAISGITRPYEWALNLSSIYNSKEPAEDIVDLLHNKSIPAEIKQVNINGKTWFRIRIRGFTSKQHALNYMLTIQERTSIKKYWISKTSLTDNNYE